MVNNNKHSGLSRDEREERNKKMKSMYDGGATIREVAQEFGMSRSGVHYVAVQDGWSTRRVGGRQRVTYRGDSFSLTSSGYYRRTSEPRLLLHRVIWEDEFGSIPSGMEVHHKDGDGTNNDLDNLELLSSSEHALLHKERRVEVRGW